MKFSALSLGLVVAVSGISHAAPTDYYSCVDTIVTKLISLYQTGDATSNYARCEKDNDGNGYAAGIVNFSTSNGDALKVLENYHDFTHDASSFAEYVATLKKYAKNEDGSTEGLDGYCDEWKSAANDEQFAHAQDVVLKQLYEDPTTEYINQIGIRFSITRAAIYDTAIVEGLGDDSASFGGIFKATNAKFDSDEPGLSKNSVTVGEYKIDELVWLQKFLDVRESLSKSGNTESIEAYRYIIEHDELDWTNGVTVPGPDGNVKITC